MRTGSVALCAGVVLFSLTAIAEQPLRSPWDGKPVTMTSAPYTCPATPNITPDLITDGFYRLDDPTHSIVDPVRQAAYNKSSGPVKAAGQAVVAAADAYRTTGSRQAAESTQHDDHERDEHKVRPHGRKHVVHRDQNAACESNERGTDRKGHHVDAFHVDAHQARRGAVLRRRADRLAEIRVPKKQIQAQCRQDHYDGCDQPGNTD